MRKLSTLVIATSCVLSGCTTMMLMNSRESNAHHEVKQQDSIVAFGRTKADSQTMPANQLLMLGQNYIYLITSSRYNIMGKQSASNEKLANILNVQLSRPFKISQSFGSANTESSYFPVELDRDEQSFSSSFCLNYYTNTALSKKEQAVEQQKLDALQFSTNYDGRRYLCMNIEGKVYQKPENMAYQYRFQTPVPVELNVHYESVNTMPALRVLGLPFAVAADIVTFPIQAVFYYALKNATW